MTDPDFAKSVFKGIVALDRPLGRLMEIAKNMDDTPEKAAIKECCGTLLRLQFDLIEQITTAHPELREK
jgi:hypothetical protein